MDNLESLTPPQSTPEIPPPGPGELVTPDILYLNQGSTFRLASAFAGTGNPSTIWQQLVDDMPSAVLYLRELEMKDEDVGDAVSEVKLSITKRKMQVLPADSHNSYAVDIATFVDNQLKALPNWRNAVDAMLDAPFYGYSITEQIFDQSAGQVSLLDLRDRPQELFSFAPVGYPQIGNLRLSKFMGGEGQIVPEQKFVIFSSRPRAGNRKGRGLLREVFWPSWFKRNTQRFWMKLAERGPGVAVVQYPQGAGDDERKKALRAAEAIVDSIAMAVPDNFGVIDELLKGARTADPKTYEALYAALEAKIYRRIVGSTLTSHGSDGGKGTQALGNVHQATKEERSVEHTLNLEDIINRQIVRQLVWWNFGPDAPMPYVSFDKSNEEDLGERVTVDDTLQQMGLPMPEGYIRKTYGVPAPDTGEAIIVRPIAAASAITTPAGPPDRPQFSQGQDQVDSEQAAFDKLFEQMSEESQQVYARRIKALARGTIKLNTR